MKIVDNVKFKKEPEIEYGDIIVWEKLDGNKEYHLYTETFRGVKFSLLDLEIGKVIFSVMDGHDTEIYQKLESIKKNNKLYKLYKDYNVIKKNKITLNIED